MDELAFIRTFGRTPVWRDGVNPNKFGAGDIRVPHAATYDRIHAAVAETTAAIQAIDRDPDLSPTGREKRKVEAARDGLAKLRKVDEQALRPLKAKRDELRAKARPADPFDGRTADRLLYHHTVERLATQMVRDGKALSEAHAVTQIARDAVDAGDSATVAAILGLPSIHPARPSADDLAEIETAVIESAGGALSGEIAQRNEMVGDLDRFHAAAVNWMEEQGGATELRDASAGSAAA